MQPYPLKSTIHPRLWSAVACHRFSYCPAPAPSAPLDLCARSRAGLCIESDLALRCVPNSFALYPFGDPHPLNPAVSTFYKNVGGRAPSAPNLPSRFNSFNCNIYGPCPVNVANKRLMLQLSSLDATLTKNTGWGSRLWGWGFRLRLTRLPLRNLSQRASRRGIRRERLHERERSGFRILGSTHAPAPDPHRSDSVARPAAARRGCRMALRAGVSPSYPPRADSRPGSRSRRLLRHHRFTAPAAALSPLTAGSNALTPAPSSTPCLLPRSTGTSPCK